MSFVLANNCQEKPVIRTPLMTVQLSSVPFVTENLPHGPWLVVLPRLSDGLFALGGTLLLAAEQGIAVDLLGLASEPDDGVEQSSRPDGSGGVIAAAPLLGVRAMIGWGLPDHSLMAYPSLIDRLAEVMEASKPACLFFPTPYELDAVNRAISVMAWEALRKTGFSSEPWSYAISAHGPANWIVDISRMAERKRQLLEPLSAHQMGLDHANAHLHLNQDRAQALAAPTSQVEAFFVWPKLNKPLQSVLLGVDAHPLDVEGLLVPMPMVSVIIRTKNRPKALCSAVASVASQTYREIELVVINDGGEDVGEVLADNAIGSIQHLTYHACPVGVGRTAAANLGLEQASGEWLMFLDDDDTIEPEHIATLITTARQRPYPRIVYSGVRGIDAQGRELHVWNQPYLAARFLRRNYFPIHSVLFQRALIGTHIRFDSNFDIFEDWDFWTQLARQASFVSTGQITATYHLCGDSGTWHDRQVRANGRLQFYAKWLSKLTASELDDCLMEADEQCDRADQLEVEIKAMKQRSRELESELRESQTAYRDLEATNQALLASTSWRITRPLRAMLTALPWLTRRKQPSSP